MVFISPVDFPHFGQGGPIPSAFPASLSFPGFPRSSGQVVLQGFSVSRYPVHPQKNPDGPLILASGRPQEGQGDETVCLKAFPISLVPDTAFRSEIHLATFTDTSWTNADGWEPPDAISERARSHVAVKTGLETSAGTDFSKFLPLSVTRSAGSFDLPEAFSRRLRRIN